LRVELKLLEKIMPDYIYEFIVEQKAIPNLLTAMNCAIPETIIQIVQALANLATNCIGF
jgi:hypothetical protein